MWLIEGLEDGGFALISKTHHALIDGIAGVDLGTVLFDLEPGAARRSEHPDEPWRPDPEPSAAELRRRGRARPRAQPWLGRRRAGAGRR